jgi:hypothetical protein
VTDILRQTDLIGQLNRMAALFPSASRSSDDWQIVIGDYYRALARFPSAVVAGAFDAHARRGEWFPKLSELVAYCEHRTRPLGVKTLPKPAEPNDPPEVRKSVVDWWREQVRGDMVRAGGAQRLADMSPAEAIAHAKAQFGVTDEQLADIPDAPQKGPFKQVGDAAPDVSGSGEHDV